MVPRDLRRFRRHMQMIFQDPFASLNARMTVGDALIESIMLHRELTALRGEGRSGISAVARSASPASTSSAIRAPFRAGSASASRSRARSPRSLRFIVADEPVSALDVSIQAEVH